MLLLEGQPKRGVGFLSLKNHSGRCTGRTSAGVKRIIPPSSFSIASCCIECSMLVWWAWARIVIQRVAKIEACMKGWKHSSRHQQHQTIEARNMRVSSVEHCRVQGIEGIAVDSSCHQGIHTASVVKFKEVDIPSRLTRPQSLHRCTKGTFSRN